MAKSRTEIQSFVRKLYRFLDQGHDIQFKKLRDYRGYIHYDPESVDTAAVTLDHRDKLLSTMIHEAIHYIYPEYTECQVLLLEREIVNGLSDRQVKNIIKRFANAL